MWSSDSYEDYETLATKLKKLKTCKIATINVDKETPPLFRCTNFAQYWASPDSNIITYAKRQSPSIIFVDGGNIKLNCHCTTTTLSVIF